MNSIVIIVNILFSLSVDIFFGLPLILFSY